MRIGTKLDFIHLVDKTRKAGYAWFRPNYQEGMNHAQPARGDYTRAAPLCVGLQRTGLGMGSYLAPWRDSRAGQTHGHRRAARDGLEPGAPVPELSSRAQSRHLVEPHAQSHLAALAASGVCPSRRTR